MDLTKAQITKIAREVSKLAVRTLKEDGIGTSEFDLIHVVRKHDGISQKGICEILGIDKSAVARQVASLEVKGYIYRKEDPLDKRINLIYPTSKAQELKTSKRQVETVFYEWLLEALNDNEKEEFASLLERVYLRCKEESKSNFTNVTKLLEKE